MSEDATTRNGGHVVVEALARAGTTAVFTIHGVQIDPIFQACADTGMALVDVRHEASAGFAAEATARLSGNIGAAAVCPGPGFTNILTSVANARVDRTPVLYVVSCNPANTQESNGLQVGLDHVAVATPITKWACKIEAASELARIVAQAIRIATTAPCGPVLLDIPADILAGPAIQRHEGDYSVGVDAAKPAESDIERCLRLLAAAERPALLVGHTLTAASRSALADFVSRTGVPCFLDYRALGSLADDHPAYGGTLYQLARIPAKHRPDTILAIGVQFGFDTPELRDGGRTWATRLIHIDADPAEVGRFGTTDSLGLIADPDQMLCALSSSLTDFTWDVAKSWTESVQQSRLATRLGLDATAQISEGRIHPYWASRAVSDSVAASNAVLIGDGAVCKHWLHDALQLPAGASYLTHGRFGCMGAGTGMAIGAAITDPSRPVVCVTGDGAVGFSIGEFEAMVRHGLAITVVVMNNARWGASQGFQLRPGGLGRVVGTSLSDADYHSVMVAFGGDGVRVHTLEDLDLALRQAIDSRGPTCINVSTNNVGVAPEVPLLNS